MRAMYGAATVEAAELALKEFDRDYGGRYPGAVDVWQHAWPEFVPFLDYPIELRKTVYTTNAIESINFQLRKITKNRGHFPDKDSAMKLIYLGLRNISSERGGYSGTGTQNWTVALNTLARLSPGRVPLC
ncbi:transposase [Mycobacterium canetti]|uniref:transposase n=1 Tax=Mycobacterium canetti TaxID=78331 RepID=UPI0022A9CC49|nr:transposase [Mycobacterium canetti]